jgi:FAD/FMN-containing dehydrogenase/ferredoxin
MNVAEFRKVAGDIKIIDKVAEKEQYSHDIGDLPAFMTKMLFTTMPDFVVQPKNVDEIKKVMAFANENKIPVVPRGAASWGFGGVIPTRGGIVIDLSPFRNIISLDVAKKSVTVEAGARWSDIDIAAKKKGLCLMTYPSSKFSTVGGWVSTGGIGINSFRYGQLAKQIESLTVVTGNGEVKKLTPTDPEFKYHISTEGEFGIVVEVTLKLRDVPQGAYPHLLYFPGDTEAFEFIELLVKEVGPNKINPDTIRFLDVHQINDMNEIMRAGVFEKSAAVLVEFSSVDADSYFLKFMAKHSGIKEAPAYVASYLWNERLFGMKTKRLGPSILASEVVIPMKSAAAFIAKAKKIGADFGVEISVDSYIKDADNALIMATFLADARRKKYIINIPLVAIITKAAVSLGGVPYGLGLWNAAFVNDLYNQTQLDELRVYKAKTDPNNVLNRGKFFGTGSKGVTSLVFKPGFFKPAMSMLGATSPVVGKGLVAVLGGKDKKIGALNYELSIHACAKCGNCIAVCPAYLVTKNEALTAKGKIALAKKLLAGQKVTKEEADIAFMCMHCKGCQEICQTNLELMNLWEALENKLKEQYKRPDAAITEFLKTVDATKEYWDMVERNN